MKTLNDLFDILNKENNKDNIKNLIDIVKSYNGEDWKEYVEFSENKYLRRIVKQNENIEILILSWKKGQETKIHDHSKNGCILRVLNGSLQETRYGVVKEITNLEKDSIGYIDNSEGLHQISALDNSVSLHIYSPPNHVSNLVKYDILNKSYT